MKTFLAVLVALGLAVMAWAGTAYFSHEEECTGFKKICVYDYLGDKYAITIDCTKLCPLTIEVER